MAVKAKAEEKAGLEAAAKAKTEAEAAKSAEKNITKTKQPEMTLVSEILQPTVLTPEVVLEKVRD